jgi:hypothetical protein
LKKTEVAKQSKTRQLRSPPTRALKLAMNYRHAHASRSALQQATRPFLANVANRPAIARLGPSKASNPAVIM